MLDRINPTTARKRTMKMTTYNNEKRLSSSQPKLTVLSSENCLLTKSVNGWAKNPENAKLNKLQIIIQIFGSSAKWIGGVV